jgi:pyruvate,orthophosphate dikinase
MSWVVPFSAGSREDTALLGGKGANLAELAKLGVPVPPGFVVTTAACRAYLEQGTLPDGLLEQARAALGELSAQLPRRFGDPASPLLVSVRSGAPVSMPGMMDTILNVGLSPRTLDGFAASMGSATIAQDCLRRVTEMLGEVTGEPLPDDPDTQLEQAIVAVFESWNSRRAQLYRRFNRIDDTGTAVVVQAMVFGNAGPGSGTGVAFTRDPSTGAPELFGEYLPGGQGEDVVAGSHNVGDLSGLLASDPAAHAELERLADLIEIHFGDMCEIEFTLERGALWILQSRSGQRSPLAAARIAVQLVEEGVIDRATAVERVDVEALEALSTPALEADALDPVTVLTTATGSSPGLATGVVVLDSGAAVERAAAGEDVVLVRPETTPKDLEGMIACTGLLTTRGGKTSHAAVVARGLGKTCVCGAAEIEVDVEARALRVGDTTVAEGDVLSLDGDGGRVILGAAPVVTTTPPAELADLRAWSAALAG